MEEKRFICKFCNKRFPCGKSLGGHIRTHMNEYSARENGAKGNADFVTVASFDGGRKRKRDSAVSEADAAAAGNSAYGLRENPKKTMRFVDSASATAFETKLCKECGKGFASLKALCGHMACHSEKERGTNKFEDNSGVSGKDKFVMDSQSDTETSTPSHPRRSKRMMRFKNLYPQPSPSSLANNSSLTEVELEQEEGAKLLLLLSKDSGPRRRLNSIADSSENNSVVLEVKSPSIGTKNKQQHNGKLNFKSAEVAVSDDSNSEYFLSGYNKIESEVSADGYPRNSDFKKPKVDSSGFEHLGSELGKSVNRIRVKNSESNKKSFKGLDFDQAEGTMRKEEKSYSFSPHRSTHSKTVVNGAAGSEEVYESLTNKNVNSGYESTYESDEQSTDSDSFSIPMRRVSKSLKQKQSSNSKKKMSSSKKNKGHECPICYRIFKSGQALGGHKRSHFVGGSEENTLIIKQDTSHVQCLIDLNLPAPVD